MKSPDPRERDYLKTIVHRVYGKFMVHRSFLRRTIAATLQKLVFDDTEDTFGHAELLEIVAAIVQGFSVPLKGEHRTLYERCLLPLHKANQAVHQQLVQAVLAYLEKDAAGAGAAVQAVLKYWPLTNPAKEILFINELEEVRLRGSHCLQVLDVAGLAVLQETGKSGKRLGLAVAERINRCMKSEHY